MKAFFKDVKKFITDWKFILPLVVVTFLGYGYIFSHFAIGIDDLTRPRYLSYENIAQGRISGTLIDFLFGFTEYKPLYEDLLSVIFMLVSGVLAAVLLKRITKGSFHNGIYTFFACFFTTFPLVNEIFVYGGAGLNVSIGYALTFISLMILDRFFESKNYFLLIPCVLIWVFNISLYESFILVYSCIVCGIFLIRHMIAEGYLPCNSEDVKKDFSARQTTQKIFTEIGYYVAILVIALIVEFIISNAVIKIIGLVPSEGEAANSISAFNLKNTLFFFFTHIVCASFRYLPITIFALCSVIGIIFAIKYTVKSKHAFYILYVSGMFFSVFILSLLRSGVILYRNIQCMVMFCGIILVIILQKIFSSKVKWKKVAITVMASLLILCQSLDLAKWFYVDYMRSENEKAMMTAVGDDLKNNYDTSKAIIFYGVYTLPDEVLDYRYIREGSLMYDIIHKVIGSRESIYFADQYGIPVAQTDNESVISWGVYAFKEVNTELLRYFKYLGYDFIQGSKEQYDNGSLIAETMNPAESSYEVIETDEFIVVKFG